MKKESKDLLMAVIESHTEFMVNELSNNISDYYGSKEKCKNLEDYFNVLDTFFDSGSVDLDETPEKINDYCSTFDSWVYVKGYIKENEDWKNDIHTVAVDKGLEDGEEEVIELLS